MLNEAQAPMWDDFLTNAGWQDAERSYVAGDADYRTFERLTKADGSTAILMFWKPRHLWPQTPPDGYMQKFIKVGELLRDIGLRAPEIYASNIDEGLLLYEDFGSGLYFDELANGASEKDLYVAATDVLIHIHKNYPAEKLRKVYPDLMPWSEPVWEKSLGEFTKNFYAYTLKADLPSDSQAKFQAAWDEVLPKTLQLPQSISLWDYHSPNLMWMDGKDNLQRCGVLDYQDAILAPVTTDLAFLLEDVRREVDPTVVKFCRDRYLSAFLDLDLKDFNNTYWIQTCIHVTRLLGQFPRLAEVDGKPKYLQHIPRLWRYLERCFAEPALKPVEDWFKTNVPDTVWGGE